MAELEGQEAVIETLSRYTQAIAVALGHRDHETRLHSDRVSLLSTELGRLCDMAPGELGILRLGATLHDVGKIGVHDAILSKAGALDPLEWDEMRQHTVIGEDIILAINIPGSEEAARIIRHHHEHFDGSGYPDGLAGEDIPLCSRIISITDSYDAMAVTRSYHRKRTHEEIMQVLFREAGIKHDPRLLDLFRGLIEQSALRVP
jgi:HD-GYP domain-containing protein (c-di-GMP phosphodiesterase class II)